MKTLEKDQETGSAAFLRFFGTSRRNVSVTTKVLISGIKNVKSLISIYFKAEDADDVIEVRDEPGVVRDVSSGIDLVQIDPGSGSPE